MPHPSLLSSVTHVALAFLSSELFVREDPPGPSGWPLFESVASVRARFPPGTKVLVAIGGWGDDAGFPAAAKTDAARRRFAARVAQMARDTGADGVDVDWEYPGGNGEDHRRVPNEAKRWEVDAFPALLRALRAALGPAAVLSVAVPGRPADMLAFTAETTPRVDESVDFVNVMTYDLMNRRDVATSHHAGVAASRLSIEAYLGRGFPAEKMNLGFAFYVKWFNTDPNAGSSSQSQQDGPVGVKTTLMEDPATGADLGQAGAIVWSCIPAEMERELHQAVEGGMYDERDGGHYFWDRVNNRWWTWETPEAIRKKFESLVPSYGLGGVFAWALGEDAPRFEHLKAMNEVVERYAG